MHNICSKVLFALALVAPALAAPGPVPTGPGELRFVKSNKPPKPPKPPKTPKPPKPPKGERTSKFPTVTTNSHDSIVGQDPITDGPPVLSVLAPEASLPAGLFKRKEGEKKQSPSIILCTPGDRVCHSSLGQILVCNDDQQWVTYNQCDYGTFCHRLHMTCVPEINGGGGGKLDPQSDSSQGDDDSNECEPGDRQCSLVFNRVNRCNNDGEWVTYHDCRMAEYCDEDILDCLPISEDHGTPNLSLPDLV